MAAEIAAGFGRQSLAFDEGIIGNSGAEGFAPVDAFLQGLAMVY